MSPLLIRILLHYHYSPKDYQRVEDRSHAYSIAVMEGLEWFVKQGLISSRFSDLPWASQAVQDMRDDDEPIFKITDKGRAMVSHLCEVPVPVCKWVRPGEAA